MIRIRFDKFIETLFNKYSRESEIIFPDLSPLVLAQIFQESF